MSRNVATAEIEAHETFGELLRHLRRKACLTQGELGQAVGYSTGQISMLEHNQRMPDTAVLSAAFFHALGIEDDTRSQRALLRLAGKRKPAARAIEQRVSVVREELGWLEDVPAAPSQLISRKAIAGSIAQAVSREPQVVIIGLPGMGKTVLAAAHAREALANGRDVFWHSCLADSGPDAVLRQLALFAISKSGQPQALHTALSAGDGAPVPAGHLLALIAAVLAGLNAPLLVFDDAHHLGNRESFAHFARLSALAPAARFLFTARAELPLAVPHLTLGGLDPEESREFLAGLGAPGAAPLIEATAGNPLLLRLAAYEPSTGAARSATRLAEEALAQLGTHARHLLGCLCVLRGVEIDLAGVAVCMADGFADYQHGAALQELLRRRIIETEAHPLPHALLREPVLAGLRNNPAQLRALQRVAANVALRGRDWAAAAHHWLAADEPGEARALLVLHGPACAATGRGDGLLPVVDALLDRPDPDGARGSLLTLRGDLLHGTSRSPEAEGCYRAALECAPDAPARAALAAKLAGNLNARGQFAAAIEYIDLALDELGLGLSRDGLRLRQQLLGARVRALVSLSRWEEARKLCEQLLKAADVLALAAPAHVAAIRAQMNTGLGYIAHIQGRNGEALALLQKGLALAGQSAQPEIQITAHALLSSEHRVNGRMAQATEHASNGLALARATGNLVQEARALHYLSVISLYCGRFDEAWARSTAAHDLSERLDDREDMCAARVVQAAVCTARGDLAEALRLVLLARAERDHMRNEWLNGFAIYQHAVICAVAGDGAQAVALAGETLDLFGYAADPRMSAMSRCLIAIGHVLEGDVTRAHADAATVQALPHDAAARIDEALLHSMIALHEGDRATARQHALHALQRADAGGFELYAREARRMAVLCDAPVLPPAREWLGRTFCDRHAFGD